jgi:hypothetical protein
MPKLLRRLANLLVRHSARVMPASRSGWSEALNAETALIENDAKALEWAFGGVLASYGMRIGETRGVRSRAARILLALAAAWLGVRMLFAPALILLYRFKERPMAELLGAQTRGDHLQQLIPLINATPAILLLGWLVAGVLYVLTVERLVRSERNAWPFFLGAVAVQLGCIVAERWPGAYVRLHQLALGPHTLRASIHDVLAAGVETAVMVLLGLGLWGRRLTLFDHDMMRP